MCPMRQNGRPKAPMFFKAGKAFVRLRGMSRPCDGANIFYAVCGRTFFGDDVTSGWNSIF